MQENKKPKVVFTFVEAGMGHIIPMTGMYNAFLKKYGHKCEVVKSYFFSESKSEKVRAVGRELSEHTKRTMSNWLYNRFEAFSYGISSKLTLKVLDMHFKKAYPDCFEDLKNLNPDLLVSSYYLPSHLARKTNEKGLTNTLIATYTPDTYVYPAWDRNCDMYIVNNDIARKLAIKKGFKKEVVKQIPFIYKESITSLKLIKQQTMEKLGIEQNKFSVLITSGAYGAKNTVKHITKLLTSNLNLNLIVICGKSQEMLKEMQELEKIKSPSVNFYYKGFVDNMEEYICASDLIIGKAGMNTIMEAVYLDKLMVVNAAANRLEELISKSCEKEKIVIKEKSADKMVKLVSEFIDDKEKMNEYLERFKRYKDDTGAERAADLLFELLKERYKEL